MEGILEKAQSLETFEDLFALFSDYVDFAKKANDVKNFLKGLIGKKDDEIDAAVNDFVSKSADYGLDKMSDDVKLLINSILKSTDKKKAIEDAISKLAETQTAQKGEFPENMETVNMLNQEILAVGDYNGKFITAKDLATIVANYNELKDKLKPPIKITHSELAPAVGWAESLRVEGDKILCDFMKVPKKIADLMRAGAYRRVSAEVYNNYKLGEKEYGKTLRAVALLGADIPEIKTLKDLEVLYNSENKDPNEYFVVLKEEKMADDKKDKIESEKKETENEEVIKLREQVSILEKKQVKLEVDKFMEDNKERILPTVEPIIRSLLENSWKSEDKVVKFSENNIDREINIREALTEVITRLPKFVEYTEIGKRGDDNASAEDAVYNKIAKYAEDNKVTIQEARRILEERGDISTTVKR